MITYAQLWAADPVAWRVAGVAWCGLTDLVDRRAAELTGVATALRPDWSGTASRAARDRLGGLADDLLSAQPALIEVDQVLDGFATRVAGAKALLEVAVSAAAAGGVLIDRRGRVSPDPGATAPDGRHGRLVAGVADTIRLALELADRADREAAVRLAELATDARAGWPVVPEAPPPPAGGDPVAVRRWWAGLSRAQRRWLVRHQPALVGRLDGLPVADRDLANRLLLGQCRSVLLARRAEVLAGAGRMPSLAGELRRIDGLLAGLDVVSERLAATSGPRAYLVALDPAGDGRVALALGDPDRAGHVLTYVPGMTSDLASVRGELSRAERMAARCAASGPTAQTATVLWLDYDAPDFLDEALGDAQARAAGPALHRFQEGLRASHEGPPAQHTVLGHSYGSLVVGTTSRDHGLAADDVILLGSPGAGVEHARELNLPSDRVWASTAGNDIIRQAVAPAELVGRLALTVALPGLGAALAFGRPADELWFGHDPSDPGFGARVFPSAPAGHLGYWDPDNPALDHIARITLGSTPR